MAIVISGVNNNDKITASDGTIDLLSGVSFASTITSPDITASNRISGKFIDVNTTIQLGVSGIATATTFVGNLTGNVNATSNLLLQIGGSEKFRVGSSGQLGIGGANYGTSGQVLSSGGSGSAATWQTPLNLNDASNNRVITSAGGATLQGEANLNFDGSKLGINITSPHYTLDVNGDNGGAFTALTNSTAGQLSVVGKNSGGSVSAISRIKSYPSSNGNTSQMTFETRNNSSSMVERLRIDANGNIFTQGLTSASFDNQGSNGRKYEFTGDGTAGKFPVINISGNSNTDGGTIGVVRFVNRENANSSSGSNNQSKGLVEFDCRSTTSDSNAGDDSGGYLRFITKNEEGSMGERFVLTARGSFKSNGRHNLGGIREITSGTLANGESVSWNGSGTTYTNGALNWNSIGGNGGAWIGSLSVLSADQAPSGAMVLVGCHGSGFNSYNMLVNAFDSGISVTPTGTGNSGNFWNSVITNTSGETIYYRMLVYHLGASTETIYGL